MKNRGITDAGKRQFRLLVESLKLRWEAEVNASDSADWQGFRDWIVSVSNVEVSKDKLYRTTVGQYQLEPSFHALDALAESGELRFLGTNRALDLTDIRQVLFGEIDAYGNVLTADIEEECPSC
jgi:hypothetical protein